MKQTNRLKSTVATKRNDAEAAEAAGQHALAFITNPDAFEHFAAASTCQVERQPIHEFLQSIPYRWSPDDVDRFGYRVMRMAHSLGLPIIHGFNVDLGDVRLFPVRFMEWVYAPMAGNGNKWPLLSEAQAAEDSTRSRRLELRKLERTEHGLREISERTDNLDVLSAAQQIRDFLKAETETLRHQLESPAAAEAPTAA